MQGSGDKMITEEVNKSLNELNRILTSIKDPKSFCYRGIWFKRNIFGKYKPVFNEIICKVEMLELDQYEKEIK